MTAAIIRINGKYTQGFQVRVGKSTKKGYYSKLFSDKVCGGKRKAKKEAEKHLQNYIEDNDIELTGELPFRTELQKNNKSGKTGVYHSFHKDPRRKNTVERYYWAGFYNVDSSGHKTHRQIRFFEDVHGKRKSKQLAIQFRKEWEEAVQEGKGALRDLFKRWT